MIFRVVAVKKIKLGSKAEAQDGINRTALRSAVYIFKHFDIYSLNIVVFEMPILHWRKDHMLIIEGY